DTLRVHGGQGEGQRCSSGGAHEVSSHRHGKLLKEGGRGIVGGGDISAARARKRWPWAQRNPSKPWTSAAFRPPMRAKGRPLSVTTTATTISLARGASDT